MTDRDDRLRSSALDVEIDELYRRLHPGQGRLEDAIGQANLMMLRHTLHLLDAVLLQVEVEPEVYEDIMERMMFGFMPSPGYFMQREMAKLLLDKNAALLEQVPLRTPVKEPL